MSKKKISIAVLTFNHEQFITPALESFLAQKTNFDFEIVIGDDASTDKTANIINTFAEKYPEKFNIIIHDKNIGMMPNSMNVINRCKGDYIAFCEGDDYWIDNEKLQKQVDFLDSNKEYAICFHDAKIFDETTQELKDDDITVSNKTDYTIDDLIESNFMHTPTVVLRNDFKLPEDFKTLPIGDWPLYHLMLKGRKIKKLNDHMAVYRVHGTSAWSSKSQIYRLERTINTIEYLLEKISFNTSQENSLIAKLQVHKNDLEYLKPSLFDKIKRIFKNKK